MSDSSSGFNQLNELAHEFAERFRRGERPALTEYTDKYPELAAEIRDLFPAMVVMEQFGSVAGPASGPATSAIADAAPAPEQLGDYSIVREVARGGMGIVFEAVQQSLGRHVALKVLPAQLMKNPHQVERFRREAKAAANLHHTNIVPVFGVGEHEGVHYYAMQFIQGQGLDSVIEELKWLRKRGAGCQPADVGKEPAGVVRPESAKGVGPLPSEACHAVRGLRAHTGQQSVARSAAHSLVAGQFIAQAPLASDSVPEPPPGLPGNVRQGQACRPEQLFAVPASPALRERLQALCEAGIVRSWSTAHARNH